MGSPVNNSSFNELWSVNLQKLDEIHRDLEKDIHSLEREYVNIGPLFTRIENSINNLASACARFNIIQGSEYILRLRTIVREYSCHLSRENVDFALLNFLMDKISELRSASFQDFPSAEWNIPSNTGGHCVYRNIKKTDYPWRWITFSRGASWFILPFRNLRIVPFSQFSIHCPGHDSMLIEAGDKKYTVKDPFSRYTTEKPHICIIIDWGTVCHAAEKAGKRIYARKDIITPLIREYTRIRSSTISKGRVRIFGRNHILLG